MGTSETSTVDEKIGGCSVPLMLALVNDLAGATEEDIANLAEHFRNEFGGNDLGGQMNAGLNLEPVLRAEALAQTVHDGIGNLMRLPFRKKGKDIPLTLEQQEDRALAKTHLVLKGISDKQWAELAAKEGRSADECRRDMWSRIFCAYRKND